MRLVLLRVGLYACAVMLLSQTADPPAPGPLKSVPVPEPPNLTEFVANRAAAIRLGKAFFWDMQVGSDGMVACATCHFNAGADSRLKNQISPGLKQVAPDYATPAPDRYTTKGYNATLTADDFPLRKLADPNNRASAVLRDSNDVIGSQGVVFREFSSNLAGLEVSTTPPDPDGFQVGSVNVRRVEPRNTPTVINAVFNHRNFWDGRAQSEFNGVNHLGSRDPDARVYRADSVGTLTQTPVLIPNASLASQAVAPPVNSTEMSSDGRSFQDIAGRFSALYKRKGKQIVVFRPLQLQQVHRDDSVLGPISAFPSLGLTVPSYEAMIKAAFHPRWWQSSLMIRVNPDGTHTVGTAEQLQASKSSADDDVRTFTQLQYNFTLFFGLAVQMYESTLVANDTRFDRFRQGDLNALTALEKQGLTLFLSQTRGRCINCHGGPELTDASVSRVTVNRTRWREGQLIDTGYNNIGVRPTTEDLGLGDVDRGPLLKWLSEARQAMRGTFSDPTLSPPLTQESVAAVDGAFKVPGLRNVELTAPYFHNGGFRTLREVIDFYSRGGDFVPIQGREGMIQPLTTLNLSEGEKEALVAFLRALTDERVRYQRAPFDHPQIHIPNGHVGNTTYVVPSPLGGAVDTFLTIPAVGRNGSTPLQKFLE